MKQKSLQSEKKASEQGKKDYEKDLEEENGGSEDSGLVGARKREVNENNLINRRKRGNTRYEPHQL